MVTVATGVIHTVVPMVEAIQTPLVCVYSDGNNDSNFCDNVRNALSLLTSLIVTVVDMIVAFIKVVISSTCMRSR